MKRQRLEGWKMLCANWEGVRCTAWVRVHPAPRWYTPVGREAAGDTAFHHTWRWDTHWEVESDKVKKATTKEEEKKGIKH